MQGSPITFLGGVAANEGTDDGSANGSNSGHEEAQGTVYYPSQQPSPMEQLNSEGEPVGVHTPTEENLGMILESIQWSNGPNPEDATPGAEPLDAAEPEGTTPVAAAEPLDAWESEPPT